VATSYDVEVTELSMIPSGSILHSIEHAATPKSCESKIRLANGLNMGRFLQGYEITVTPSSARPGYVFLNAVD
jgi:hypothetical protein